MHIVFRESHSLDGLSTPYDVNQDPGDLIFLSFSDSDLGAFAAGWRRAKANSSQVNIPSLRLANLTALSHPLSIDTYVEKTACKAKGILVRLIGGKDYWSYGLMHLQDLARQKSIALAILPADGRDDPQLEALSTVPLSTLKRLKTLCDYGGEIAAQAALAQLALASGLYLNPVQGKKEISNVGFFCPSLGCIGEEKVRELLDKDKSTVILVFYRSYLTSVDLDPVNNMILSFREKGINCFGIYVSSLKNVEAKKWLVETLKHFSLSAIVNATAFSAKSGAENKSPLENQGCPVFQISLSTARKTEWEKAERGLSPTDLAMHVALPELDGNIYAGAISFKSPERRDKELQYSRFGHETSWDELNAVVEKLVAWIKLGSKTNVEKKLSIILSTYPSKEYQIGHAVGLDTLGSGLEILKKLHNDGFRVGELKDINLDLLLRRSKIEWDLRSYIQCLEALPEQLVTDIFDEWGDPLDDPLVANDKFQFSAIQFGNITVALQPDRALSQRREEDYHNLKKKPCHGYVAFYLWHQFQKIDGLIHLGAHGTLEWLPGKSIALSINCWPRALTNNIPIIYPFIVNDPGEAAQAKRRISAVTLGHMPPNLVRAKIPNKLVALENLLDEYSTADGLDPRRKSRIASNIRLEAETMGLNHDLGIEVEDDEGTAITRIDSFVCDIKESQFGHGLHIFGTGDHGEMEMIGLKKALSGDFVPPGPSGSPFRGKSNVLPTGRNMFAVDPRSIPTKVAYERGIELAKEFLLKHLQENGEYPKGLMMDLWGSATMRTAGEEFSMALYLVGVKPIWDKNSERVNGFEVIPLSILARPRIDLSLRISGLFRDIFPILAQMFDKIIETLVIRDEPQKENPYTLYEPRVFGPQPGTFGVGINPFISELSNGSRGKAGINWLKASSWVTYQNGKIEQDQTSLEKQVLKCDSYLHIQDMPETDLLMASDYAAHEGGFSAAADYLGSSEKKMYHLDTSKPDNPRTMLLKEEIAKVVRARAANSQWINGMMQHGFRGAAEIASTLDNMAAFANLTNVVPSHLFDLYYAATLGSSLVRSFLEQENPLALKAMEDLFERLKVSGYWLSRRNSIDSDIEVASG